jgi:hypothetical protein
MISLLELDFCGFYSTAPLNRFIPAQHSEAFHL